MDALRGVFASWQNSAERRASKTSSTDESSTGSTRGGFESQDVTLQISKGAKSWTEDEDFEQSNEQFDTPEQPRDDAALGLDVPGAVKWRRFIFCFDMIGTLATIALKWLVAVMLRKIFIWLEETFTGARGFLGLPTSKFWETIFLEDLPFYTVFSLTIFVGVLIALGAAILRALPVRLAGAYARARRARLVDLAINTRMLSEMEINPSYLLEQISVLFEFEANVKYQRTSCVVRICFVIVFCLVLFWQGTLLNFAFLLAMVGLHFILQDRMLEKPSARRAELMSKVHACIIDVLRGADVVATHNMEKSEMKALAAKEEPGIGIDREMWQVLFLVGFPELIILSVMMPSLILLARLMLESTESVSDAANTLFALTAMFFVFDEGHKSLRTLIDTNSQAHEYAQALERVNAALTAASAQGDTPGMTDSEDDDEDDDDNYVGPGPLIFEDVTVQYPRTSAPAVRDISFTIPQGLTMAIVAESGGGKSTLFRVASALVRHQSGNVFYGNIALNDLTKHAIRKHMGFVSQDSMLFARTIRENIWYGNVGEPDDSVIWSVLENLGLGSWVHSLDDGLGTVLATERMVSGGQAQRLQIARLLCRQDVYYVLLDECMSALDPVMRATVTQALKVFLRGKTAMVITHSHDTVSDLCDKVLDLGKLAHGEDRAIQSAREYVTGLSHGARVKSAAWNALFSRHVN